MCKVCKTHPAEQFCTYQSCLQCVEVMANLSEKEAELVVNDVHLLLGLHALLTLLHMKDVGGDLLQGLHFLFPAKELTLHHLYKHRPIYHIDYQHSSFY